MSQFEYLSVLVSLILGLGIAHLLLGVGGMIHRRREAKPDPIHLLWVGAVFWTLVLNWWVFFQSQSTEVWSFDYFLVVIVWAVLFFLLAVILFPPDVTEDQDYAEVFERNRGWFLGVFAATSFADILLTAFRGDLLDPPIYLPFVLHFAVLGVIGMFVKSRRFHVILAGYVLGVGLTWSLVVRRFLEA
jgi:hypothetical protein